MTEELSVRIERIIDASPEAVFAAWTTRDAMEQWYRDGDDTIARVTELEASVGGNYRVEWGPDDGAAYVEFGTYLEFDPPRRLVMSETLEVVDAHETPWANTTVTVEFHDEDGKTRLVLTHTGFPSADARDAAKGGWPGFIDRVEAVVALSG